MGSTVSGEEMRFICRCSGKRGRYWGIGIDFLPWPQADRKAQKIRSPWTDGIQVYWAPCLESMIPGWLRQRPSAYGCCEKKCGTGKMMPRSRSGGTAEGAPECQWEFRVGCGVPPPTAEHFSGQPIRVFLMLVAGLLPRPRPS